MPPAEPNDEHLAELRRRWETEPDSRVFLQLAEEYRRRERYREAAEVLESGLASHPNHVSAHVALGRVRLALGDADGAAASLERALGFDATNLVANKALVEAHLARGERSLARQRLGIYRLLNESDPAIGDLERRVRAVPPGGRPAAPVARSKEPAEEAAMRTDGASEAPQGAGGQSGQGGQHGGGRHAAGDDSGGIAPAAPSVPRADETAAPRPPVPPLYAADGADGNPFGDLDSPEARRLYLHGLGSEGLFPMAAPPPTVESPARPTKPAAELAAAADPEPTALGSSIQRALAVPAPGASAEPSSGGLADLAPALPDLAIPEPALPEPAADEPAATEPAPPPAEPAESGEATVTLGRLYLEQGHPHRAREIFSAVLDREPDNAAAYEGLARAAATEPTPVTAQELLQDADPDQPVRTALLHAYLARIRRGRGRRDVS
ncbi:MAG TPA: tetratricopeptide repeat protein [Thermoanaerobaculia bacterium]|nr:tetratricopeptide repeat protein [Thermoanaerobaculia bacterium]